MHRQAPPATPGDDDDPDPWRAPVADLERDKGLSAHAQYEVEIGIRVLHVDPSPP